MQRSAKSQSKEDQENIRPQTDLPGKAIASAKLKKQKLRFIAQVDRGTTPYLNRIRESGIGKELKLDKDAKRAAKEAAEGMIRIYGENASIQADLIAARMARHKTEHGTAMWREIAEAVRKMKSSAPMSNCNGAN